MNDKKLFISDNVKDLKYIMKKEGSKDCVGFIFDFSLVLDLVENIGYKFIERQTKHNYKINHKKQTKFYKEYFLDKDEIKCRNLVNLKKMICDDFDKISDYKKISDEHYKAENIEILKYTLNNYFNQFSTINIFCQEYVDVFFKIDWFFSCFLNSKNGKTLFDEVLLSDGDSFESFNVNVYLLNGSHLVKKNISSSLILKGKLFEKHKKDVVDLKTKASLSLLFDDILRFLKSRNSLKMSAIELFLLSNILKNECISNDELILLYESKGLVYNKEEVDKGISILKSNKLICSDSNVYRISPLGEYFMDFICDELTSDFDYLKKENIVDFKDSQWAFSAYFDRLFNPIIKKQKIFQRKIMIKEINRNLINSFI